jgi:hypothetical protein
MVKYHGLARGYLFKTIDNSKLSFLCQKLYSDKEISTPFDYTSPEPKVFFLIVNVQNDERLMSAIKEREKKFIDDGYEQIIGLRDMYSEAYDKLSPGTINNTITNQFIKGHNATIQTMNHPSKIFIYFSIMELEAWLLGMYGLFQKLNPTLTVEFVTEKLHYNLKEIDPQKIFFKPSNEIDKIFSLCKMHYNKKRSDIEKVVALIDTSDYAAIMQNKRCSSFTTFYQKIKTFK